MGWYHYHQLLLNFEPLKLHSRLSWKEVKPVWVWWGSSMYLLCSSSPSILQDLLIYLLCTTEDGEPNPILSSIQEYNDTKWWLLYLTGAGILLRIMKHLLPYPWECCYGTNKCGWAHTQGGPQRVPRSRGCQQILPWSPPYSRVWSSCSLLSSALPSSPHPQKPHCHPVVPFTSSSHSESYSWCWDPAPVAFTLQGAQMCFIQFCDIWH